jgi:hypothetical protein
MTAEVMFACVLSLTGGQQPSSPVCDTPYLHRIAYAVDSAHQWFPKVPAEIIVSVIYHESRFRQYVIGTRGEVGLMQPMRGGAIQGDWRKLSNHQLADVDLNIWIGTGHLAKFAARCRAPRFWLTPYNGGRCVVSKYSTSVLKELQDAKRRSISMEHGHQTNGRGVTGRTPHLLRGVGRGQSVSGPALDDQRDQRVFGRRGISVLAR